MQYEIWFNDDETRCVVLERYRDSQALVEHAEHIGDLMGKLLACGSVSGELLGDLSPELRASMADGPVGLYTLYQSL